MKGLFFIFLAIFALAAGAAEAQALPWVEQAGTGHLLLMSDIHLDPFADPHLVKALIAAPVEQWEKIFDSVSEPFSPYGKDSNDALMISALADAQKRGPYDFALVTGDYLVHDSRKLFEPFGGKDEQAYEDFVTKTEIFVSREVQKYLAGTPVYFSLGNNDSECGDYMMAAHTKFLDALAHEWDTLKNYPDAQKTMADAGYYAIPHPTLTNTEFIILNDIYWSNRYSADSCHAQPNDRAGEKEMDWLKARLARDRATKVKAILVMHIPPQADFFALFKGMTVGKKEETTVLAKAEVKNSYLFWGDKYEKTFVKLMRKYPDTVVFSFAGHTHMDDFRILSDKRGRPFLVTHLCPAISPIRGNNPAYQVMEYDRTTGAIEDMVTFFLKNLAAARGPSGGQWDLEYDFDYVYGVTGYNAASLKTLTDQLDSNEGKLDYFAQYYISSAPELIKADSWKKLNDFRLLSDEKELEAALKNHSGESDKN